MFTNHFNKSEFSVACNVDDWSAWGLCSATVTASGRDCGTQTRTRTREVIQEPNHEGTCFVPVLEERLACSTEKREGKVFGGPKSPIKIAPSPSPPRPDECTGDLLSCYLGQAFLDA